jgi:3' terminal RNA ribose 2'-O-methyltransferase Hen1
VLLTLRTTHSPASDLGYLLHKNPSRAQTFDLSFGRAHVFYPEVSDDGCTVALLLDVDPVGLVRGRGAGGEGGTLDQYVNDRPYVASSFMSVAISEVFGSALAGRSKERPQLAAEPIPLVARVAVLPCRGGEPMLRQLFEPLGYSVSITSHALDERIPEWGASRYYTVEVGNTLCVSELLSHLYVLIPVLDDQKHYWVGSDEVDKLLRHGEGWLAAHPARDLIAARYLRHRRSLVDDAIARLVPEEEGLAAPDEERIDATEVVLERPLSLHEQRLATVVTVLKGSGAARVIDLGCGEGKLLRLLLDERQFEQILGMDVSYRALEIASERLRLDRLPPKQRERITLIHGSLMYRDSRLTGFDAAALVEVIEHLDPPRLAAFERVLFEFARPNTVVITTPNAEYNVRWETLPAGELRHADHRFEWTRDQFRAWAEGISTRFGYAARFLPVGQEEADIGAPTQMAIFTRS